MKNSGSRPESSKKNSIISSTTNTSKKNSVIYKSIYLNIENLIGKYNKKEKSRQKLQQQPLSRQVSRNSNNSRQNSKGSVCISKPGASLQVDNFLKDQRDHDQTASTTLNKNSFVYHYIVGKGGFGKVWKVANKKTRQFFALKEMLKSLVMTKKSIQSVINQKTLLSRINSPFIVNMHYAFQDREVLYLVMDLMTGGDLRYHIGSRVRFTQIQAKFFIACIVLGLEYLHTQNIIHRDIKPENLVFDHKGYIRITDLGIARIYRQPNSSDTSGTPGYMSPQVICRQDHSFVSDYFALGVIAYQLMLGKRPYPGRSRKEIRDQILAKQVEIKKNAIPDYWSAQAADFINKLIQRKPQNRLGYRSIQQIKDHPWIRDLNWTKLINKEIESPFVPTMKKDNFDQDQQITLENQQQAQLIEKNTLLLRKPQFHDIFRSYHYDRQKKLHHENTKKVLTTAECSEDDIRKSETSNVRPVDKSVTYSNITDYMTSSKEAQNIFRVSRQKDKQNFDSLQTAARLLAPIGIDRNKILSKSNNDTHKQYFPAKR